MKILILFMSFVALNVSAKDDSWNKIQNYWNENVHSVSLHFVSPAIDTYYELGEREVDFVTNAAMGTTYSISTKHFDLSYTDAGTNDEEEGQESDFNEIYFKTQLGDFEFTFHRAEFSGAGIEIENQELGDYFFDDYDVEKFSLRLTYYFTSEFNKVLNHPLRAKKCVKRVGKNIFLLG